jgi:hypothetical protein
MQLETPEKIQLPDDWMQLVSAVRQHPAWHDASSTSRNSHKQYQEIENRLIAAILGDQMPAML